MAKLYENQIYGLSCEEWKNPCYLQTLQTAKVRATVCKSFVKTEKALHVIIVIHVE